MLHGNSHKRKNNIPIVFCSYDEKRQIKRVSNSFFTFFNGEKFANSSIRLCYLEQRKHTLLVKYQIIFELLNLHNI